MSKLKETTDDITNSAKMKGSVFERVENAEGKRTTIFTFFLNVFKSWFSQDH